MNGEAIQDKAKSIPMTAKVSEKIYKDHDGKFPQENPGLLWPADLQTLKERLEA